MGWMLFAKGDMSEFQSDLESQEDSPFFKF